MIKFTVPLKTKNPLNGAQGRSRGAVFAKAARRKKERETARLCTVAATDSCAKLFGRQSLVVTMSRLSAGTLDGDGLQASMKSIRDGIADAIGVDDADRDDLRWVYEQRKCKRGEFGVEVQIS